MKVLLYSDHIKIFEKSGIGRAMHHQKKAVAENCVPFTTDKKQDYDIVHINTIFPSSLYMSILSKLRGKKVVFHAHSTEEDFKNSFRSSNFFAPLFKKWLIQCYNSSDLIITPTPYSKSLLEGYGLKRPIVSISNGIDLDYFTKDPAGKTRFREKYHFSDHDLVIVSVGHYIERKGILDFVKLAQLMPEYKFVWFGSTNLNAVPTEVKMAVETKLPNLFFPGYISRDNLKDAYSGSDLFLFLTHEETEGIVLLEAFAMKIPILIRDITIYKKWLTNEVNIYKGNSLSEFQEKIRGILGQQFPSLVENGYLIAQERNIKSIGQQLQIEYKKLVTESKKYSTQTKTLTDGPYI